MNENENTTDDMAMSPASTGSGGDAVKLMRRACRVMGRDLISVDRFVVMAIEWLRAAHGNIRVEYVSADTVMAAESLGVASGWHVEPIDTEGTWTGADAGHAPDIAGALAASVVNTGLSRR
jgi:hypothetical protein